MKQISACGKKSHYDMTLHFTINLAFWQLLKQYQPKLARKINLELKRLEQTFPVKMFNNSKGPLQMPSTLPDIVKQLNEEGNKFRPSEINSPPIFSRFELNIITVATGALACICRIATLVIGIKQFRLQALVSSLGLVSLIPPTKAYQLAETMLTKSSEAPFYLARGMQNEKVVCAHPLLTALGSTIVICGALYAAYQVFRSLSWYHGYKNSRCCTIYFFLYHDNYYE